MSVKDTNQLPFISRWWIESFADNWVYCIIVYQRRYVIPQSKSQLKINTFSLFFFICLLTPVIHDVNISICISFCIFVCVCTTYLCCSPSSVSLFASNAAAARQSEFKTTWSDLYLYRCSIYSYKLFSFIRIELNWIELIVSNG